MAVRYSENEFKLIQERMQNRLNTPEPTEKPEKLGFKSKLELEFSNTGFLFLEQHIDAKIEILLYEPFKLSIPGGIYTPDFFFKIKDISRFGFVETKGSKRMRNYRDARSKLRAAAEVYWYFEFYEARKEKGLWIIERI